MIKSKYDILSKLPDMQLTTIAIKSLSDGVMSDAINNPEAAITLPTIPTKPYPYFNVTNAANTP